MTKINWLHVSDFHFCGGDPYDRDVVLRALVRSVARFRERGHRPDLVFATGDVAHHGQAKEYELATKFFDDLLEAAGLERHHLYLVPGNHDVDRTRHVGLVRTLQTREEADAYFAPKASHPHLHLKMGAFRQWYDGYFKGIRSLPDSTCGPAEAVELPGGKLGILPLNSALFCQDDSDHDKLWVGRRCLDGGIQQLKDLAADLNLALIHHPLEWLSGIERANITGSLQENVDLVLHGHLHETAVKDIVTVSGGTVQCVAGAAYQSRKWPNKACYCTIDGDRMTVFPIRYEDQPQEFWTVDTSLYPDEDDHAKRLRLPSQGAPAGDERGQRGRSPGEQSGEPNRASKMTAADRDAALRRYLEHIISSNRFLQLQGIRSRGRLVHIELDRIYIRLRTVRQRIAGLHERWLAAEASLAPGERRRLPEGSKEIAETVTVSVEEALADERRLVVLGDPGSGKTTLLRYLASLYGRDMAEGTDLVREKLGLAEKGHVPILLPLRQVASYLRKQPGPAEATEGHAAMLGFLAQALENERIAVAADFFDPWLAGGTAVILLDGLDEVADPDLRRRVSRLVESFTQAYPQCRYVVTSRIVGYKGPARLGEGFATTTVRDFTMADVEQFLCAWHSMIAVREMGAGDSAEVYAAAQTSQLLTAIHSSERIRDLAINPLMLTAIAMVHRDQVKLPDRRAELYAEMVDVLLGKWDEGRGVEEPSVLPDRAFEANDKRLMLQNVALHMHEQALRELDIEDLKRLLIPLFRDYVTENREAGRAAERFLGIIEERAGLLGARGEGTYAFSHLTFQEYLAALAIASRDDYVGYALLRAPDRWWREVVRLEAGYLGTQSKERTTKLIEAIANLKEEPEPYHNLVLARDCLGDVGAGRVRGNLEATVLSRLRTQLARPAEPVAGRLRETETTIDVAEGRATAMEALGGVAAGYWREPFGEPEWIVVPSGAFWMGEGREAHRVFLDEYTVARVPVTNAQYRLFVESAGHGVPRLWEDGRPPRGLESHPVVEVTWFDAIAYCRWLSRVTGKSVVLPSEAEWEKAARGDKDKRAYPWGDEFDAKRCNSWELGIHKTTPVGMFPEGASPYGCLDMSGNVWEWTRSLYGKYPYPKRQEDRQQRENIEAPKTESRVLRGGSFYYLEHYVRCAYRYWFEPDYWDASIGFRVAVSPVPSGL